MDLSDTLRRRMVVFPDLICVDDRGVQAMLKEIDRADLLLALRGADAKMQDLLLRNMSNRAAADLRDELEIMGPTPRAVVEQAQENIVEVALRLADEQIIFLAFGNSDAMI
jgi:flagellar motor switch protein FliG